MAIDPQQIGASAMQFMQQIEQKHGEQTTLEGIVFLAVIDDGNQTHIEQRMTEGDGSALPRYKALGILASVDDAIRKGTI